VSAVLQRSFLRGRSMGEAVTHELEETVSMLAAHGQRFAPIAVRKTRSFQEFMDLRQILIDGGGVALRVKRRIEQEIASGPHQKQTRISAPDRGNRRAG
jgi:hypothetical protein